MKSDFSDSEHIGNRSLKFLSFAGYEIDVRSSSWQLDKSINIRISSATDLLNERTADGFIRTLRFYASNYSASHTRNCIEALKHLLKVANSNVVTCSALINYRATLTKKTEWRLGTTRGFLKRWHELGHAGVSADVVDLLNSWVLSGNIKGDVVKRLDPEYGPLSDIELQNFNESVIQAMETGKIALSDLSLCLLVSQTGRRPTQIVNMKVMDVADPVPHTDRKMRVLNIPRAKQRGTNFRGEFRRFSVSDEFWILLRRQANCAVQAVDGVTTYELSESDLQKLPLFPDLIAFGEVLTVSGARDLLESDYFHLPSRTVTDTLKRVVRSLGLRSERTGQPLKINATRLRYTIGTRAAREGYGEMVIAELLDHSDMQNAGVYIKNIPEHVEAIDRAVGKQMAIYAQAFAGVLVKSETEAVRGSDMTSRIGVGNNGVGTCGSYGFCGANAPIPCYTCAHFQPWVDGPHQVVLDGLLADRSRVKEITDDQQIANTNDRTILAVTEVIERCKGRRSSR